MKTGFSLWELTYREFPVSLTEFGYEMLRWMVKNKWISFFGILSRSLNDPPYCPLVCTSKNQESQTQLRHFPTVMGLYILAQGLRYKKFLDVGTHLYFLTVKFSNLIIFKRISTYKHDSEFFEEFLKNFLKKFFIVLLEFLRNSLEILWEFFGNSLGILNWILTQSCECHRNWCNFWLKERQGQQIKSLEALLHECI